VIENAFEKDFLKSHPIRYNKTGESNQDSPPQDLTAAEEASLRERLKDMGYF